MFRYSYQTHDTAANNLAPFHHKYLEIHSIPKPDDYLCVFPIYNLIFLGDAEDAGQETGKQYLSRNFPEAAIDISSGKKIFYDISGQNEHHVLRKTPYETQNSIYHSKPVVSLKHPAD